jgi:hypothetical protein
MVQLTLEGNDTVYAIQSVHLHAVPLAGPAGVP